MLTADSLRLGYLGDERTLDYYRQHLPSLSPKRIVERTVDDDIADRRSLWVHGDRAFRATLPPAKLLTFTASSGLASGNSRWTADAAFGIVVGPIPDDVAQLVSAVESVGGRLSLNDHSRDSSTVLSGLSPEERDVLEQLKRAFDGAQMLNPIPTTYANAHRQQSVG